MWHVVVLTSHSVGLVPNHACQWSDLGAMVQFQKLDSYIILESQPPRCASISVSMSISMYVSDKQALVLFSKFPL